MAKASSLELAYHAKLQRAYELQRRAYRELNLSREYNAKPAD